MLRVLTHYHSHSRPVELRHYEQERCQSTAGGKLFDYDATLPLNAVFGAAKTSGGVVRQPLAYDATETLRFKTIFVHPRSGGPWPLLIWSRGSGGDRTQQLPDAVPTVPKKQPPAAPLPGLLNLPAQGGQILVPPMAAPMTPEPSRLN